METFSSVDAKNSFGDVVQKAQDEPVCIEKHGKPVAYMLSESDFNGFQEFKREQLHKKLDEGLQAVKEGRVIDSAEVMERLRKKYFDGDE